MGALQVYFVGLFEAVYVMPDYSRGFKGPGLIGALKYPRLEQNWQLSAIHPSYSYLVGEVGSGSLEGF